MMAAAAAKPRNKKTKELLTDIQATTPVEGEKVRSHFLQET
jgi:hypothetical protein